MWVPVRFFTGLLGRRRALVTGGASAPHLPLTGGLNPPRIISVLLLALASFALGGCSAIKIAYNQAPELAYWYLNDYVDFSSEQSLPVKAELARFHAWHRQTQLPGYIEQLQSFQRQVAGDLTPTQACAAVAEVRRGFMTIVERMEPVAAKQALSLDAAQLQTIERHLAKGNTEYRKDYLEGTPKAISARRMKQATKRAEMLYGRLDAPQIEVLQKLLDESVFDARRAYAERLRRQQDVLLTLRAATAASTGGLSGAGSAPAAAASMRTAVRGLMDRAITSPNSAYRAYADQIAEERCQMVAQFHNSTSPLQRQKAAETLRDYETDARMLLTQGAS